jgi:hypothetical protein
MSSELTVEDLSPTEFCFEKGKLNFKKKIHIEHTQWIITERTNADVVSR